MLSGVEVYGNDSYDTAASTTTQLEYYQNSLNSKIKQYNDLDSWWWLRSAGSNDGTRFRYIERDSTLSSRGATDTIGISPAFRIG